MSSRKPKQGPKHILGVGLDNADGHKRVTQAEQFSLIGGSEETHGKMTETMIKTFESIKDKGKQLEDIEPKELFDIIQNHT